MLLLTTVAASGAHAAMAEDGPKIVTSIKPLYSLTTALTAGTPAETTLLVKGAASPHTYSMAPSEARALQEADIVFWIGPSLEHFLEKPLEALGGNADVVELEDVAGVETLSPREGGAFEPDDDEDHDEEHGEHEGHHHGPVDPHMWLDPMNAKAFVSAMAETLASEDPDNAAIYNANAEKLDGALDALTTDIKARLADVSPKPYIVFHDAYHYFGDRFDVEAAGSVTVNPEAPPSAHRIQEIHDKLTELGAACVFSEPQFPPKVIDAIAEGTDTYVGTLDPIGADLQDGPDLYFTLLNNLADGLVECFEAQ
ncbi:zinc transporter [Martelella endophytica]|uniref:High-affinity zinc uptake system protein ZnuA n=2 Tax=Martelella endophytica TaxID=1486262 RepID=A0A0D5LWN0_MAREN|nr:zinc transporter [Martelella endophytica]